MRRGKKEGQVYIETDGKVYLVKDGGLHRFPLESEPLPFDTKTVASMTLGGVEIRMKKPLIDYYPETWLDRDEILEREDVYSVVKNAVYMTMMRCVSELAITREGQVLMVKAKRGFSKGYWNLPGGFIQYGESPEVAGARETYEEIGIRAKSEELIDVYISTFPNKPTYTLGFVYRGRILGDKFHPKKDEIESVEWHQFDFGLEQTRNPFAKWGLVDLYRRLPEADALIKVHSHGLLKSRRKSKSGGPVVFLDRDGVINQSRPGYVKKFEEFEFLPGAIDAMKRLCDEGFRLAIVSNQDVMGWKIIGHQGLKKIHGPMVEELARNGVRIEEIYYCPHHILSQCGCHKPRPAMLLAAARDLQVTPRKAWMVGDKMSDVVLGKNFGCWTIWIAEEKKAVRYRSEADKAKPNFVCQDLASAADNISSTDMERLIYRAREL